MKKITSLLLLFMIAGALLGGCGGDKEEAVTPEPDSEEEINLYGAEFLFATGYMTEYFPSVSTDVGDRMKARYTEVGEVYNCTFSLYQITPSTISETLMSAAGSASSVPDLIDVESEYAYPCYKAGYLHPLDAIETIDLSDGKWGIGKVTRTGEFGDHPYGFYPYDWEFIPQVAGALMFNLDLINQYNLDNPFELQEAGTWNWETFRTYLQNCTFTDGDKKNYGLQYRTYDRLVKSVIFSNEGEIVIEQNGKHIFGLSDPKAVAAFDYLTDLNDDATIKYDEDITVFSVAQDSFFCHLDSYWGTVNIDLDGLPANIMKNWQFITFPYGPSGSVDTVSTYDFFGNRLNYVTDLTMNNFDELGLVLDYVFAPLEGTGVEAWKSFAEQNFFLSTATYDNFIRMIEHSRYDYSKELNSVSSPISTAFQMILTSGNYAAQIEKITQQAQTALDEFYAND